MKSIQGLVFIIAVLSQVSCSAPDNGHDDIDRLFIRWDNSGSPGCSVLVLHRGKTIYRKAFGMANISGSIKNRPTSLFHVASITKQFTGAAIAILENRDLLDKNEEVRKYIPELPRYGKPIKIKHLLDHTSGIPEYQYLGDLLGLDGREGISKDDFFDLLNSKKDLNNGPGDRYIYSNSNYVLLALIVERVTGMGFPKFVENEIFIPLGMVNSKFINGLGELSPGEVVQGYDHDYQIDGPIINRDAILGDGGMVTNVDDLAKWAQNLLHDKLIEKDAADLRPYTGHYDYGLQFFEHNGLPTISHGGVHFGFRSMMLIFPTEEFAVIITGNIDDQEFFYNSYAVADLLIADRYTENKGTIDHDLVSDLERYTGKFTNQYLDGVVQVSISGPSLSIKDHQTGENYKVFPKSLGTFILSNSSGSKKFRFDQGKNELYITDYDGTVEQFNRSEAFDPQKSPKEKLRGTYKMTDSDLVLKLEIDENGRIGSDLESEYFNDFEPLTDEIWMNKNINMMTMRFLFDGDRVKGFTISTDRLKDLQFEKVAGMAQEKKMNQDNVDMSIGKVAS